MSLQNDKDWNDAVSAAFDCVRRMVRDVGDAAHGVLSKHYSDPEFLAANNTTEAALRKACFLTFYVDAQEENRNDQEQDTL